MDITEAKLAAIFDKLSALPAKRPEDRKLKTKEAIQKIKPQIKVLRKKGYTLIKIAEILTKEGLAIKPTTIQTYLQKDKDPAKRRTPKANSPQEKPPETPLEVSTQKQHKKKFENV